MESRRVSDIQVAVAGGLTHVKNLDEWCAENGVTKEEWAEVWDMARRQADEQAWMRHHRKEGGEFANTTATLKSMGMDAEKTKLVMEVQAARSGDVVRIQPLVGQEVAVELYPVMMPLPLAYDGEPEGQQALPGTQE